MDWALTDSPIRQMPLSITSKARAFSINSTSTAFVPRAVRRAHRVPSTLHTSFEPCTFHLPPSTVPFDSVSAPKRHKTISIKSLPSCPKSSPTCANSPPTGITKSKHRAIWISSSRKINTGVFHVEATSPSELYLSTL